MPTSASPEAAAEAREHRERHLHLHAQDLPALDEKLAEKLALVGRRHALGRPLDEEDALLALAVAQDERPRLATDGEVEEARRQPRRIELPAVDGVRRELGVPLERGARQEARELGVLGDGLEAPALARDGDLRVRPPPSRRARRGAGRASDPTIVPSLALDAVDLGRHVGRLARDDARRALPFVAQDTARARVALDGRRGREPRRRPFVLDRRPAPATRPSFSTNAASREGPTWRRRRRTTSSSASAKARGASASAAPGRARARGRAPRARRRARARPRGRSRRGRRRGCAGGRRAPSRR